MWDGALTAYGISPAARPFLYFANLGEASEGDPRQDILRIGLMPGVLAATLHSSSPPGRIRARVHAA